MKNILIILCLLLAGGYGFGQTKKELRGEWFTNNLDSAFFKSDTLIFFKRTNREKDDSKKLKERGFLESESIFVKSSDYVNIEFKNGRAVSFWETYNGYINTQWTLPMKWKLKNDIITIASEKFEWNYEIISKEEASFEHLVSNTPIEKHESLSTPKLILIRKNVD